MEKGGKGGKWFPGNYRAIELIQCQVDFKRAASITPISGSIEDICVCAHQGLVAIVGGDSVLVYKLNPSIPDGMYVYIPPRNA